VIADPPIPREIPDATVARLPEYLRALSDLAERGIAPVSSEELAASAGVRSAKLRKNLDLATELQILAFHEERKALAAREGATLLEVAP
jgi:NADH/NAD ratio-sensing transcriptional regulator Rex